MAKPSRYEKIMARDISPRQRAFLDYVSKKWYVETAPDKNGDVQGGNVTKIIYDKYGVPVCLQVDDHGGKSDYISVERVTFFEPWDCFVSDYSDYEDSDRVHDFLIGNGYVFDEEECLYRHPETGEEVCW